MPILRGAEGRSFGRSAWALSLLLVVVGCGGPAVQKPTTPEEVEEVRQRHAEMSNRELNNQ